VLIERAYRMRYLFSAVFSTGVMIPVGFEYGFRTRLNVVHTRPEHWEHVLVDITAYITAVNRMRADIAVLNEEGEQRQLDSGEPQVVCLQRRAQTGPSWVLSVINTDLHHAHDVRISGLDPDTVAGREVTPGSKGKTAVLGDVLKLAPGAARIFVNA
jgi:starch synthase (maltosyl-transferring)